MKRLALLLFIGVSCVAWPAEPPKSKDACKTPFAVAHRTVDSSDPVAALSKPQNDWWEQKGAKKYPDLCLVFEEEADYLLVWEDRVTRKDKDSDTHTDPLQDRDALKDRKDTAAGMSREEAQSDIMVQEVGSVEIFKRATGEGGKRTWKAIGNKDSVRDATGWFANDTVISGAPTRKAMEDALKFIRKRP
ncbi:MAG TPA: hypothetical protein VJX16_26855 [Terriglobales bacterium]|nr:hypothetical protein [Terriglobales bacterium]